MRRRCSQLSACVRCACSPTTRQGRRPAGIRHRRGGGRAVWPPLPHSRNVGYLRTKEHRLGPRPAVGPRRRRRDARPAAGRRRQRLIGPVARRRRPTVVVLKFAQTLDGRIATATGDARWISGEAERRVSHALRAACDAVLVGVGTVLQDDPQLTVRMVPGVSPMRVVLDSTLRVPDDAKLLEPDAATTILTTERCRSCSAPRRCRPGASLCSVLPAGAHGVDVGAALAALRAMGRGDTARRGRGHASSRRCSAPASSTG